MCSVLSDYFLHKFMFYFRKVEGGKGTFLESASSQLPSAQNNPCAKGKDFGVAPILLFFVEFYYTVFFFTMTLYVLT